MDIEADQAILVTQPNTKQTRKQSGLGLSVAGHFSQEKHVWEELEIWS